MKKTLEITINKNIFYSLDGSIDEVIILLQELKAKGVNKLNIDDNYEEPKIAAIIEREETDEEELERIGRSKKILEENKAYRRKLYEDLKKEFE